MTIDRASRCRALVLVLAAGGFTASAVAADDWLVYLDGGMEAVEGGWSERHGRVIFTKVGGTLASVRFDDVDLAASTFITWQLDGRRRVPARPAVEEAPPLPDGAEPAPCVGARPLRLLNGESLEVEIEKQRELIHVACLDTPESNRNVPALGWFGRAAMSVIEVEIERGALVCLTEQTPPRRDGDGHRIVYVKLADGRDLATTVIEGGCGLLRPPQCRDGARYRAAENTAIRGERGLWGRSGAKPAFDAAQISAASVPPGSRGPASGCRLRN